MLRCPALVLWPSDCNLPRRCPHKSWSCGGISLFKQVPCMFVSAGKTIVPSMKCVAHLCIIVMVNYKEIGRLETEVTIHVRNCYEVVTLSVFCYFASPPHSAPLVCNVSTDELSGCLIAPIEQWWQRARRRRISQ